MKAFMVVATVGLLGGALSACASEGGPRYHGYPGAAVTVVHDGYRRPAPPPRRAYHPPVRKSRPAHPPVHHGKPGHHDDHHHGPNDYRH